METNFSTSITVYQEVNAFRNPKRYKIEVELGVNFNSESETDKIGKAVSSLVGVESVSTRKEIGRLFVVCINPQVVATCIREFEKMVQCVSLPAYYWSYGVVGYGKAIYIATNMSDGNLLNVNNSLD
ncbi:hypothetical protein L1987_27751 [Smallanthus sonchifolius]|uniref:Uncharacterized protein n=1 Tax=Smallanthus sonchifolius TaxID=185202 RepID=A0ACB9IBE9_9ASTR|nr:hypothetical protein L1987_27751 [Smallanthus sonchifolius]